MSKKLKCMHAEISSLNIANTYYHLFWFIFLMSVYKCKYQNIDYVYVGWVNNFCYLEYFPNSFMLSGNILNKNGGVSSELKRETVFFSVERLWKQQGQLGFCEMRLHVFIALQRIVLHKVIQDHKRKIPKLSHVLFFLFIL